jgi:hypothetical protein
MNWRFYLLQAIDGISVGQGKSRRSWFVKKLIHKYDRHSFLPKLQNWKANKTVLDFYLI